MATILDTPPQAIQADLDSLSAQLDNDISAKADDNLLIATWNIRSFASLTREWTAASNHSPKRDLRGLRAIIEILSRFDVIAIQEVKGNLRALRDTVRFLDPDWGFLMSDVTGGAAGNNERARVPVSPNPTAALWACRRAGRSSRTAAADGREPASRTVCQNSLRGQFFSGEKQLLSWSRCTCSLELMSKSGSRNYKRSPTGCETGRRGRTASTTIYLPSATSTSTTKEASYSTPSPQRD